MTPRRKKFSERRSAQAMDDDFTIVEHKCKFCGEPLPPSPERVAKGFEFFRCTKCDTPNVKPLAPQRRA
jgi:hypothetical protein